MSVVTTFILAVSPTMGDDDGPTEPIVAINDWLAREHQPPIAVLPRDSSSGTKAPQADLFIGAYNHLCVKSLLEAARTAPWLPGTIVQLFVKEECDFDFKVRLHLEIPL